MHVHERITVNQPPEEVYAFWRNLTQLPLFMEHLVSVQGDPDGITHWKAKSPTGTVDWDAKIVEDKPNELIAWRSLDDSEVRNMGTVRFAETDLGMTDVVVDISYDPPMGALGEFVASLLGESPEQEVSDDLRRFKQIMESGRADVASTPEPESPRAFEAREELIESRDETHAATNRGRFENDLDPQEEDNDAPDRGFVIGGPMVANIGYPSTGIVGTTDAADAGVIEGGTSGPRTAAGADVANDIDPDQLGLSRGQGQDPRGGNDGRLPARDERNPAGHRDGEPEHDIAYRVSGAPL